MNRERQSQHSTICPASDFALASIDTFVVRDDERFFPNNNHLPVIVYRHVFDADAVSASKFEDLFRRNHFGRSWRDGIYTYHHYHSTAHEALGCYAGRAQVRLGGDDEGVRHDVELSAGDAILISPSWEPTISTGRPTT